MSYTPKYKVGDVIKIDLVGHYDMHSAMYTYHDLNGIVVYVYDASTMPYMKPEPSYKVMTSYGDEIYVHESLIRPI